MSSEEWQSILCDFSAALRKFELVLQLKTSFLHKLPWLLGGIAHHDVAIQRDFAKKCIDAYDDTPKALRVCFGFAQLPPRFALSAKEIVRSELGVV